MFDFLFSLAHRLFSPERAAASYVAPLARHVVVLNIGSHRSDVLELELGYIATSVEEEGLAVSTILFAQSSADVHRRFRSDDREIKKSTYPSCSAPTCLSGLEQNDTLTGSSLILREIPGCICARYSRPHNNDVSLSRQFLRCAVADQELIRFGVPERVCRVRGGTDRN